MLFRSCSTQKTIRQHCNRPFATPLRPPNRAAIPPFQQRLWTEDVQTARACNKGHGRYERRTLSTTTWLNAYLDWPQVGQVFRLVRERVVKGRTTTEVVYGITSLSRQKVTAARLLDLSRAHWGIENGLHYTRDETLGEEIGRAHV